MKTRYLLIMLLAALSTTLYASEKKTKESVRQTTSLKGVWQMCFYVSETPDTPGEPKPGNTFKVLSEDGYITNFTVIPNKGAIITGYGTYKQVSDSVYHENIERSIHLPMLNNQINALQFELCEGGKFLRLKFYIEKDEYGNTVDTWYHETWKRVEMPDKYPDNLVR